MATKPYRATLLVAFLAPAVLAESQKRLADKAILVDRTEFLQDLRLGKPELSAIKAAMDGGNLAAAGVAYTKHFRKKPISSPMFTDWTKRPRNGKYKTTRADKLLAGHFWDGYNVYEVPATGIDWRKAPLVCITRFPIFGVMRNTIHHTRDPKYVRFVVDHLLEYLQAYPIDEFVGKGTQGFIDDYTVVRPWHWCMMPERISEAAKMLALIRQFPQIKDEELLAILHRVYQETIYVRLHMKEWVDRRHNGGLGMISGMAYACALLEDFRATDEWGQYSAALMAQYIDQSFYPDGQCIEITTAYSASVARQSQRLAHMLRHEEGIRKVYPKLVASVDWAIGLSKPTGRLPSFGDLRAGHVSRAMQLPALDWLDVPYAKTIVHRTEGPLPPHTVWPAPGQDAWGGYYAMRSDWTKEARYLCIDAGPWGTCHRHGDKLSFVVTAHGADFIVDPWSTIYRNNQPEAFISTQAASFLHNTVTVDGVDEFMNEPSEAKTPLQNRWEHGQKYSLFEGSYSFEPVKPVTWKRRVLFADRSYWLVQDVLTGDQESAQIEQNFQFAEHTQIDFRDVSTTVATAPNGARLLLIPFAEPMVPVLAIGDERPHTTYWSSGKPRPNVGVKAGKHRSPHGRGWVGHGNKLLKAPAVTYTGRVRLPAALTLAIVPVQPKADLTALASITSSASGGRTLWRLPLAEGTLTLATSATSCSVLP